MEGSEKWLSPPKSTASPKPSSSTGENDENDTSQDKMIPKFQNQKKTASKHFMSATISAASKAAPPRKKILSERNENLSNSDVQNHKASNLDKKKSPRNSIISHSRRPFSRIISSYDCASEPDDDWDTNFIDNSSVKAYDPVKNYLSPRPKYLRFNPNRRREIFSRLENEELNRSFDSQEDKSEEIEENEENIENKESDVEGDGICSDYEEVEEEAEEIEEERGWCFRGVIKFVLILIACVLSTSYICTMNSRSPTPTEQAFWKAKDGCLMIKRQTLELIGMKMHEAGFLKVEAGDDYGEFEEEEFEADYNGEIIEDDVENLETVEFYEDKNREIEESVKFEVNENANENSERVDNGEDEESVDVEIIEEGAVEISDEIAIDKDRNREIEDTVKVEIVENNVGNLEKVDNELVENEIEISQEKMDNVSEIEGARYGQYEVKTENFDLLVDAKTDESANADSFCLEKEVEESYSALSEANVEKIEYVTESYEQSTGVKTDESEIKGSHEKSTNSGHEIENEKVGRKNSVAIGFAVISTVLALLAIIVYHLKKKPRNAFAEKSESVLRPHKLAAVEEKRKVEFIARPSLSHSIQEAPKKLDPHHICPPTVELIGEIVVGQVSSSRRIRKYEAKCEESNADYLPKCGTLTQLISAPSQQPSGHEYSNTNSPSYESFTSETKILKKEGGAQSTVGVTPVRRSSRLRIRAAVTSP